MSFLSGVRLRLGAFYRRHAFLLLLVLLFVAFRAQAVLLFRPGGYIADFSDYEVYFGLAQLLPRGYHPGLNLVTAYPPLFPTIVAGIFELASKVPHWADHRLVFYTLLGFVLLAFEPGNFLLIMRLARRLYPSPDASTQRGMLAPAWRPPLIYALLFAPVYTMLGWFEAMPLFFLLLGLELLLAERGRPWTWLGSAVAVALGVLTKLIPAVLLPVAACWLGLRFWQRSWWHQPVARRLAPPLYGAAFFGALAVFGYLLTRENPSLATSSLRALNNRAPWQSVWALLDGYYGYGVLPLDARNVAGLSETLWESRLPWAGITIAFGALYAWLITRPYDWRSTRTAVVFAGASLLILMLMSRGWSPQFVVWVLAFVVLLLPGMLGAGIAVALSLINFAESNIYLILVPDQRWLLVTTVLLRTALLIALVPLFLAQIWPAVTAATRARALGRGLAWAALLAAICVTLAGAPHVARAYVDRRLREHPCPEVVARLRQEAQSGVPQAIATAQFDAWQSFYPWLNHDYSFTVLDDYPLEGREPAALAEERLIALAEEGEFWWLTLDREAGQGDAAPEAVSDGLAGRFFAREDVRRVERIATSECRLDRIIIVPPVAVAVADVAGGPVVLRRIDYSAPRLGAEMRLALYWEAAAPVNESYTVFTQLLDASDQMVAQQDNLPAGGLAPTDAWTQGTLIRDLYTLRIPSDTPPGQYRLLIGLYNGQTRRVLTFPDGSKGDALTLPIEIGSAQ